MRKVNWPVVAAGIYAGLAIVAGLVFLILTGVDALDPDAATAFWLVALGVFILPFGTWLLLHAWIYVDAERRGMNGALWALLSFFLSLVGPIVYLLLRQPPRSTCPGCGSVVSSHFTTCPHCGQPLRLVCSRCGGELQSGWRVCPACGTPASSPVEASRAAAPPGPL